MGIEKKPVLKEEISRGEERTVEAGENMVHVKGGCFKMVCSNWALYCDSHFMPKHEVCVEDFHIDKHEITQKAYRTKMGKNPSYFKGDNNPVESVKWQDAKKYCEQRDMRLPTEAEWVYAASNGGVHFSWSEIENRATFKNYAWYNRNTKHKSQETGQKAPNSLGLFDMDGNVWEWVGEWQDSSYVDKVKYNTNNLAQGRYLFNLSIMDLPSYCDSNRRARSCGNTEKFRRALVIGFRCAK